MAFANRIVVRSSSDNHVLFKVFRAVYNTAGDEMRPYFEHRHSELEISVIASGSGIYTCSGVDYDFSSGDVFLHCGNDEHFMKYIAAGERLSMLVFQFDPRLIWTHGGEWFDTKYLQIFTGNSMNSRHMPNTAPEAKAIGMLMEESLDSYAISTTTSQRERRRWIPGISDISRDPWTTFLRICHHH